MWFSAALFSKRRASASASERGGSAPEKEELVHFAGRVLEFLRRKVHFEGEVLLLLQEPALVLDEGHVGFLVPGHAVEEGGSFGVLRVHLAEPPVELGQAAFDLDEHLEQALDIHVILPTRRLPLPAPSPDVLL